MKFRFKEERNGRITSAREVIGSLLKKLSMEDPYLIEFLREEWNNTVGDIIATHSMPDRIFKGVLYITADHSVYASEISMMKNAILIRVRDKLKTDHVKDIRVEVKKVRYSRYRKENRNNRG